jgi:small subunit ribosomal protein S20
MPLHLNKCSVSVDARGRHLLDLVFSLFLEQGDAVASHKSALKRIKQTRKRQALNRMHHTTLRHQIRKLRQAIESKDLAAAQALAKPTFQLIDSSIHKGVLHRNTASRYKSRLNVRLNALLQA